MIFSFHDGSFLKCGPCIWMVPKEVTLQHLATKICTALFFTSGIFSQSQLTETLSRTDLKGFSATGMLSIWNRTHVYSKNNYRFASSLNGIKNEFLRSSVKISVTKETKMLVEIKSGITW
jgi:hypothetical protein